MRLLIAEDDPKLLKSLTHIFERNKFSVDGVTTGEEARSTASRWSTTAWCWTS